MNDDVIENYANCAKLNNHQMSIGSTEYMRIEVQFGISEDLKISENLLIRPLRLCYRN